MSKSNLENVLRLAEMGFNREEILQLMGVEQATPSAQVPANGNSAHSSSNGTPANLAQGATETADVASSAAPAMPVAAATNTDPTVTQLQTTLAQLNQTLTNWQAAAIMNTQLPQPPSPQEQLAKIINPPGATNPMVISKGVE